MPTRIGILRETKKIPDQRCPFTPAQAAEIQQRFPQVTIVIQKSTTRCFSDDEFRAAGLEVRDDVGDCDVLMGIKEVAIESLLPDKTYLFFSHTIKKQAYNRGLLQAVLARQIRLIDYEALKDRQGNRVVAFGRYAGMVGAYNALWAYGLRHQRFRLRRAFECFDVNDLKREVRKVDLPAIRIALTGSGRVARGAMETLDTAGIRKVSVQHYLNETFREPVYTQLSSRDYHHHAAGNAFNREEFYAHPQRYVSHFAPFARATDLLIAGAYWHPLAPRLFTKEDMSSPDFRIRIIADITCDIEGSIPSTVRASSILDPLYDIDRHTGTEQPPLTHPEHITVMAVDNLPCELPRSASEEFGRDLIDRVLRPLLGWEDGDMIDRATLTQNGLLTEPFRYLQAYAEGA